jgi:hypothetical protein
MQERSAASSNQTALPHSCPLPPPRACVRRCPKAWPRFAAAPPPSPSTQRRASRGCSLRQKVRQARAPHAGRPRPVAVPSPPTAACAPQRSASALSAEPPRCTKTTDEVRFGTGPGPDSLWHGFTWEQVRLRACRALRALARMPRAVCACMAVPAVASHACTAGPCAHLGQRADTNPRHHTAA